MPKVTDTLTIETTREGDDAHRFALVAQRAGVTARSTSTYTSEANAVDAATRMTAGGSTEADAVERDDGYAVRLRGGSLEAATDTYPDREQVETILGDLTS